MGLRSVRGRVAAGLVGLVVVAGSLVAIGVAPAGATTVTDEASFRAAWTNPAETQIDLANDITFTTPCTSTAVRSSTTALTVNGDGHTLTLCTNAGGGVLEQVGTGALTFQNVTVTGGTANAGAGGAVDAGGGGAVTVANSTFTTNTAFSGGAILAEAVTVTNSTFTTNSATAGNGGAIFTEGVTVANSTFTANRTIGSGGAIQDQGAMMVTNSTFTNNSATTGLGGAIFNFHAGMVTNSTFTTNTAPDGGAVADGQNLTVTNSTFTANTTTVAEGVVVAGETLTVTNSTFTTNTGGAIAGNPITVAYSTLTGNSGNAVDSEISITLFGSVFVKPGGAGNLCLGTVTSLGYNFANETANTCHLTATGDTSLDANDPLLGTLAANGGPTQTQLPKTGSPLIDAIPAAACQTAPLATGITTDQRGLPRPDSASPNCDIGAVEVQPAAPPTALVVTPAFTG